MKSAVVFLLFILISTITLAQVVVYPAPTANFNQPSNTYRIRVIQNGVTKNSFVYKSDIGTLDAQVTGRQKKSTFHFTTFSFIGTVSIQVTKLNSNAGNAIIRPAGLNVGNVKTVAQKLNKTVSFKLSHPAKLSVEFNDDPTHTDALMIFADRLEKPLDIPAKTSNIYFVKPTDSANDIPANVQIVYFKPGVYKINYWVVPEATNQIYIAGGAYVRGYLDRSVNAPLKINGRGILSNEGYNYHYPSAASAGTPDDYKNWYPMINLERGQNHLIEGITLVNGTGFCIKAFVNNTTIDNVNIHGFRFNNDAITIGGTGNVIKNCFLSVYDDAIVPYASNLTVTNCTIWQLSGSVFQLGWAAHSMNGINISSCFVLHDNQLATSKNIGFINAINLGQAQNGAIIQNINVSDIYFDTPIYRFVDIRGNRDISIAGYKKGTDNSVWVYRNLTFKNIHFSQDSYQYPLVYLQGLNDNNPISNIKFEGLHFNKKRVSDTISSNIRLINLKNTSGIDFK